ncbi:hypothetical protein CAEBREN_16374 [Caenorhabditis brenneri]|uniref:Tyrosine-protein kinase n=1 Tax=Caenorhabditis brenneri TaxID=135651 RepID=G0NEV3_CAEBE|nr:hypothetical protein CAEBREN_16374 [Caenorhabditis brenneri]
MHQSKCSSKLFFRLFHGQKKKMIQPSPEEFIQIPEDLELTPRPLEDEEYFHGFLVDEKVVQMFENAKNDSFLVRRAQTYCGLEYVLSVKTADGLHHIIINVIKERRLYWIDRHVFKSIRQLIEFYVDSGIFISVCAPEEGERPISVRLKHPVKRFNWQINHEQIELNQVLGSGQFGEVCKGYLELSFKQGRVTVAVKMVKGGDQLTTKQMYDLVQEAENMKKLQHPNVVRFYGIAASKNPCMMALEFCHGGSLDKRLESSTTEHQKIRFLYHAALGMEYLHDVGIVHGFVLSILNLISNQHFFVEI